MPRISNSLVPTLRQLSPENFGVMWQSYNDDPKNISILGPMADAIDEVMQTPESRQLSFACRWALHNNLIPASNTERIIWRQQRVKLNTPEIKRQSTSTGIVERTITHKYVERKRIAGGAVKYWILVGKETSRYPKTAKIPDILRKRSHNWRTSFIQEYRFKNPFEAIEWIATRLEEVRNIVNLPE